jgi:hypothetical protein
MGKARAGRRDPLRLHGRDHLGDCRAHEALDLAARDGQVDHGGRLLGDLDDAWGFGHAGLGYCGRRRAGR